MSGGAGYVLSKEAVKRFVEVAIPNKSKCKSENEGAEDVEMGKIKANLQCHQVANVINTQTVFSSTGKCLANVQVFAGDSRDNAGRGRFFPFVPEHHLIPGHVDKSFWYWKYIFYKTDEVTL